MTGQQIPCEAGVILSKTPEKNTKRNIILTTCVYYTCFTTTTCVGGREELKKIGVIKQPGVRHLS